MKDSPYVFIFMTYETKSSSRWNEHMMNLMLLKLEKINIHLTFPLPPFHFISLYLPRLSNRETVEEISLDMMKNLRYLFPIKNRYIEIAQLREKGKLSMILIYDIFLFIWWWWWLHRVHRVALSFKQTTINPENRKEMHDTCYQFFILWIEKKEPAALLQQLTNDSFEFSHKFFTLHF